jgi:hypothetical protein
MKAARAYGDETPSHVVDPFDQVIRDAIRRMKRSADGLDRKQVKLLEDFGTHGRYIQGFRQVCEIARNHCQRPEDAVALADQLRCYILAGHVIDLTTPEAMLRETEANEFGNHQQFRHAYYRSRGTVDGVIEAMSAQEIASRFLMDAMVKERPTLVQVR